jgi:hypothetical protein
MKTFISIPDTDRFRDHPLHATVESLVSTVIVEHPDYSSEDTAIQYHLVSQYSL